MKNLSYFLLGLFLCSFLSRQGNAADLKDNTPMENFRLQDLALTTVVPVGKVPGDKWGVVFYDGKISEGAGPEHYPYCALSSSKHPLPEARQLSPSKGPYQVVNANSELNSVGSVSYEFSSGANVDHLQCFFANSEGPGPLFTLGDLKKTLGSFAKIHVVAGKGPRFYGDKTPELTKPIPPNVIESRGRIKDPLNGDTGNGDSGKDKTRSDR